MSVGQTSACSRPTVSTRICRFLLARYPQGSMQSTLFPLPLTLWLSMVAAVGRPPRPSPRGIHVQIPMNAAESALSVPPFEIAEQRSLATGLSAWLANGSPCGEHKSGRR